MALLAVLHADNPNRLCQATAIILRIKWLTSLDYFLNAKCHLARLMDQVMLKS
jgi:hypothetical protein